MKADIFYKSAVGRAMLMLLQRCGGMRAAAFFLHTRPSRLMIRGYVERNEIDMAPFAGQRYASFAEFFARTKEGTPIVGEENELISPCDGRLSAFAITDALEIPMKGSHYRLDELIPDEEIAEQFRDGLCLVFRLEASDYHHFCYMDDGVQGERHFIPGQLHSVQPIACHAYPVYRLNRRWWCTMDTAHLGRVAQIEVGAMAVGGVRYTRSGGAFVRGEEMGNFELAGSTIVVLLQAEMRKNLELYPSFRPALGGSTEIRVRMGEGIGSLCHEKMEIH